MSDEQVERVRTALRDNLGGYFYAMYNARDDDAEAALTVAARAAIAALQPQGGWQDIASARAAARLAFAMKEVSGVSVRLEDMIDAAIDAYLAALGETQAGPRLEAEGQTD